MDMAKRHFEESIAVKQAFLNDPVQMANLVEVAKLCVECYKRGNKILIAGNGGSAADAQHFAGELVSRYNFDRPPLSAIALTTDTSILTAIGNDYGYESVFSRQVLAHGKPGDIFFGISTSGNSDNIIQAAKTAKMQGLITVGLSGMSKGALAGICDFCVKSSSMLTPQIQESHITMIHILCGVIEFFLFKGNPHDQ